MHRVRIGLTGLAFVFLAVLLAAVFTGDAAREEPITANLLEQERAGSRAGRPPAGQPTDPAEPLVELGVAPGKADANSAAPKAAPPVAQPPAQ